MKKKKLAPRIYIALYLRKKKPSEKLTFAQTIHNALAADPFLFPNPPSLTDFQILINELKAKILAAANGGDKQKEELAIAVYKMDTMLVNVASFVESMANKNPMTAASTIKAAGLTPRKTREKHPVPDAVELMVALFTGLPGKIEVKWSAAKYARAYELFITTTPQDESSWAYVGTCTKRKFMVQKLLDRTRYHFRLVSVGTSGRSKPSQVASQVTTHH